MTHGHFICPHCGIEQPLAVAGAGALVASCWCPGSMAAYREALRQRGYRVEDVLHDRGPGGRPQLHVIPGGRKA